MSIFRIHKTLNDTLKKVEKGDYEGATTILEKHQNTRIYKELLSIKTCLHWYNKHILDAISNLKTGKTFGPHAITNINDCKKFIKDAERLTLKLFSDEKKNLE